MKTRQNKKNIAFISFNTGGTLGHMTLLSKISDAILDIANVTVMSEHEYEAYSHTKDERIDWVKFTPQTHTFSNGGEISHSSRDEIAELCKERQIDLAIYSTFFDPALVQELNKQSIDSMYVTYPLRDTYTELFFLRENDELFKNTVVLEDLMNYDYPVSVTRANPILLPYREQNISNAKILVTCGGGGRPSSIKFMDLISEYSTQISELIPESDITIVRGPNNKGRHIENVNSIDSTDRMSDFIDEADIVVSEAGYYTVHELISRSKPSILVPGARRIDNQELRAIEYEKKGLGYAVMPEEGASRLVACTLDLLTDTYKYNQCQIANRNHYQGFERQQDVGQVIRNIIKS